MSFFRIRLSAAVAWAMIPLAAWAGMPNTGCVCANGRLKLFCQHVLGTKRSATNEADCASNCCPHEAAEQDTDCCGSGFCCHGDPSGTSGVSAKSCCNPIVSAPSVAPETVSVPCVQAPAMLAVVQEVGALVRPSFVLDVAEFNTGPPLDRVIIFRSLLI